LRIYQIVNCYGNYTTIITEDLNKVLDEIQKDFDCTIQVIIWIDGKAEFYSKEYEKNEFNYDIMYVEIINFIQNFN